MRLLRILLGVFAVVAMATLPAKAEETAIIYMPGTICATPQEITRFVELWDGKQGSSAKKVIEVVNKENPNDQGCALSQWFVMDIEKTGMIITGPSGSWRIFGFKVLGAMVESTFIHFRIPIAAYTGRLESIEPVVDEREGSI